MISKDRIQNKITETKSNLEDVNLQILSAQNKLGELDSDRLKLEGELKAYEQLLSLDDECSTDFPDTLT